MTKSGSVFTNHSQEHPFSFSPRFANWNVTQIFDLLNRMYQRTSSVPSLKGSSATFKSESLILRKGLD